MLKREVSSEKSAKNAMLQMIGLTRSSSQEVAEGYGPAIQKAELLADAKGHKYPMDHIRDI